MAGGETHSSLDQTEPNGPPSFGYLPPEILAGIVLSFVPFISSTAIGNFILGIPAASFRKPSKGAPATGAMLAKIEAIPELSASSYTIMPPFEKPVAWTRRRSMHVVLISCCTNVVRK